MLRISFQSLFITKIIRLNYHLFLCFIDDTEMSKANAKATIFREAKCVYIRHLRKGDGYSLTLKMDLDEAGFGAMSVGDRGRFSRLSVLTFVNECTLHSI